MSLQVADCGSFGLSAVRKDLMLVGWIWVVRLAGNKKITDKNIESALKDVRELSHMPS